MACYILDHRWVPIERITVGSLYRSIYKAYCHCGALLKRDTSILLPPEKVEQANG